jgi:hypothetical protein
MQKRDMWQMSFCNGQELDPRKLEVGMYASTLTADSCTSVELHQTPKRENGVNGENAKVKGKRTEPNQIFQLEICQYNCRFWCSLDFSNKLMNRVLCMGPLHNDEEVIFCGITSRAPADIS